MSLSGKQCVPCEGGVEPLPSNQIQQYLADVDNWQLTSDSKAIYKDFKFNNYLKAQDFVIRVGYIAQEQGHHPDIKFGWGYAQVKFYTHAIGGLHDKSLS